MSRTASVITAAILFSLTCAGPASAASSDAKVMPCVGADGKAAGFRYPVQAQKIRREGQVGLNVVVDDNGRASKVVVSRSSGSAELDKAARVAARSANFCLLDGHTPAAPGVAQMRVDFKLDQLVADR